MTESDGAITTKKYKIQWQCAALYATEMLVNSNSNIDSIICENMDDFELLLLNGDKIVVQVTHTESKSNFSKRDKKISKSLKNFKGLMKDEQIINFWIVSNVSITGNKNDDIKLSEILSDENITFFTSQLETDENTIKKLLEKTIVKKLDLDFLDTIILKKLGEKYGSEYPLIQQIAKSILDIIRESSTAATKKELQYEKIFRQGQSKDKVNLPSTTRISKIQLQEIVEKILLDSKKIQHSLLQNGLLLLTEPQHPINTLEEWKRGFDFDLAGIRKQLEYKRENIIREIIDCVKCNTSIPFHICS